jgi:hypothetical protein
MYEKNQSNWSSGGLRPAGERDGGGGRDGKSGSESEEAPVMAAQSALLWEELRDESLPPVHTVQVTFDGVPDAPIVASDLPRACYVASSLLHALGFKAIPGETSAAHTRRYVSVRDLYEAKALPACSLETYTKSSPSWDFGETVLRIHDPQGRSLAWDELADGTPPYWETWRAAVMEGSTLLGYEAWREQVGAESCRDCGASYPEGGDGWDGLCPNCADKKLPPQDDIGNV